MRSFGEGLPPIRDWAEEHFQFSGFITGFDHAAFPDRDEMRAALGYSPDETVCIVTVGGSGLEAALICRVIEAHPIAAETVSNLRTVVVTGPRIEPEGLPSVPGVELKTFLPDLHRHLAVADISVVQGGLATTMELTALRRPFIYVPLENHFEQQVHVRHRLERHKAGRPLQYHDATPETIAEAIIDETTASTDYVAVPRDGARKATDMVASLL